MPSTINGIGTHYYGKKNETTRKAVCNHCHNNTTMTSYETRLWCVFIYVPIIPLKKKRIIDMCSACSYHFAHDVEDWETGRQQAIATATDQLRSEGTVGAGLDMHATLLAYREMEEAADLRESLLNQYPDNVKLLTGIANHLGEVGLATEARRTWNQLHKLDSELAEPRYHIAIDKMNRDRLDEARELLRFLDEPGAEKSYNYDLLLSLAELYQKKGKHDEVLEITTLVGDRFPDYATNHRFRALVRKSEKVASVGVSSLPPVQHSASKLFSDQYSSGFRWFIGLGIAAVVGLLGMAINNYYISTHRAITIINGTGVPAMVQVDEQDPVQIVSKGTISVAEGHHQVNVTGPLEASYEVDVASGYFSRWSSSPLWLINIGSEAMVVWQKHHYAVNPPPSEWKMVLDPVMVYDNIDHPFTKPPQTIEVEGKRTRILTSVEFRTCGTSEAAEVAYFKDMTDHDVAKAQVFAKRRLTRSPEKADLLTALLRYSGTDESGELEQFIQAAIDRQGDEIKIVWHRAYQDISRSKGKRAEVTAHYKSRLDANPNNPALIYLYARLNQDSIESNKMIARAIELGDESGFAHFAQAYRYNTIGEWAKAKAAVDEASEKSVPKTLLKAHLVTALFGLKEYDQLQTMFSVENKSASEALVNALGRAVVEAMKLGTDERASEVIRPLNAVLSDFGVKPGSVQSKHWQQVLWGSIGQLKERIEVDDNTDELIAGTAITQTIEAGELEEAQSLMDRFFPENSSFALKLAIEHHSRGDSVLAESWLKKSIALLNKQETCDAKLLASLSDRPVTLDSIRNINLLNVNALQKPDLFLALAAFSESDEVRQKAEERARHFMIKKSASWPFYLRHLGDE